MNELPKRKSTRLKEFDYSQYGYYFVTICLKDRRDFFSTIANEKVILTTFGKIVDDIINNLCKYYDVEIDYYVIMPDHIHLIIIFDLDETNNKIIKRKKSLSDVIGKFKSFSTKKIREQIGNNENFEWQKSFYDRIIRNEKELFEIRKYIMQNPIKWEFEKNLPQNLEM